MSKVVQTIKKRKTSSHPSRWDQGPILILSFIIPCIFQVSIMNTECLKFRRKSLQHVPGAGWAGLTPLAPLLLPQTCWEGDSQRHVELCLVQLSALCGSPRHHCRLETRSRGQPLCPPRRWDTWCPSADGFPRATAGASPLALVHEACILEFSRYAWRPAASESNFN